MVYHISNLLSYRKEKIKLVNSNKLRAIIIERGMTQKIVAEKLGMAPKTFYSKVKKGVFGSDEINQMIDLLKIQDPMSIFFGR